MTITAGGGGGGGEGSDKHCLLSFFSLSLPFIIYCRNTPPTVKAKKFGLPKIAVIILKFEPCGFYHRVMCPKDADGKGNSVDPDQTVQAV